MRKYASGNSNVLYSIGYNRTVDKSARNLDRSVTIGNTSCHRAVCHIHRRMVSDRNTTGTQVFDRSAFNIQCSGIVNCRKFGIVRYYGSAAQ